MITTLPNLDASLASARVAQATWADTPVRQRLKLVERFRQLLVSDCDPLCAVMRRELGKPGIEVVSGEVLPAADACRFLLREAERILRPVSMNRFSPTWMMGSSHYVHRRPRGVVGVIGTWNYPLFLNAGQILPALVAGNAVVWKPSEVVPEVSAFLMELLMRAAEGHAPPGLVQALPATREMGPELAKADVDHILFTGSAAVGRKLAAQLGGRLITSTLELSGCDLQLILADANIEFAARAAWFSLTLNRSQTCIAVRRVFVHRSRMDAFCDRLRPLIDAEPPMRLAMRSQVDQVEQLVNEAVEQGATLLVDRPVRAGEQECRATVVHARPEMRLCREAPFAPVLAVIPFDDLEDALRWEQQCGYALAASIFTSDHDEAGRIAAMLRAGHVSINEAIVPMAHPATPFGGRGESGWGVTQGAEGLLEMTVPQAVSNVWTRFRPYYDLSNPQKAAAQEELLRGMLEATHGAGWLTRMKGWWRVLRRAMRGL